MLASANIALQLVPAATARLVYRYPQARVDFESLPVREIVKVMVAEEADLALSSAALDHPSLEVRGIGKWSLVCAMSHQHPLAEWKVLALDDI